MREGNNQFHRGVLNDVDRATFDKNVLTASAELQGENGEQFIAGICDTDRIHYQLFRNTTDNESAIGTRRTDTMRVLYFSEGRVLSRATMCEAADIEKNMSIYAEMMKLVTHDQPPAEEFVLSLACAVYFFSTAHAYADGNGRTMRFIVQELCKKLGYRLSEKWTIGARPYDRHFSYAIRHYLDNQHLLAGLLRNFVEPVELVDRGYRSEETECFNMCRQHSKNDFANCYRMCMGMGGGGGGGGNYVEEWPEESYLEYISSLISG